LGACLLVGPSIYFLKISSVIDILFIDKETTVKVKGSTTLAKNFNFMKPQLGVRFISNGSYLPIKVNGISSIQSIFVSNHMHAGDFIFD
jgi:hypothetical protein